MRKEKRVGAGYGRGQMESCFGHDGLLGRISAGRSGECEDLWRTLSGGERRNGRALSTLPQIDSDVGASGPSRNSPEAIPRLDPPALPV